MEAGPLLARTRQAVSAADGADADLVATLGAAHALRPSAALANALGVALARLHASNGTVTADGAASALHHFRDAVRRDPGHAVAGLNLAESLAAVELKKDAAAARTALARLDHTATLSPAVLDAPHFPPAWDLFRVEWERAAWAHAGDPAAQERAKRTLLRWRLHYLLGRLTGDPVHAYEAVLARGDLPVSAALLGALLVKSKHPAEALPHLYAALAGNPFDLAAARSLHDALATTGDARGAAHRRLLAAVAPDAVPAEPWFAEPPTPRDALASVIVLCCNEVAFTRACLDSVLAHTRQPYELVLVDNGSTDATPALLEEVKKRPGPSRVEVIRNETNVGYPAGCNQALARSAGRWLVFLNNDTLVTPGWLDGLVAWALHDWPHVGLVGPVSNGVGPGPQLAAADYDLADGGASLVAFAARRRRDFAGKAVRAPRVTGFCLLARREVLDAVGAFDERYGLGFFDDDDLCLRVRQAGRQLLAAQDVYVHHHGGRTFRALGLDVPQQLRDNFEKFKAKWGPEHAAPYRPTPVVQAAGLSAEANRRAACTTSRRALRAVLELEPRHAEARRNLAVLLRRQGREAG
jgi:GT2 family glycosyltransferase